MYLSEDPVVQRFLAKRNSLGAWARENVSWEGIAIAAGIELEHLLGAATLAMHDYGKFIAMEYYPEVIKKRIEFALLPGGWRDREALDKLIGLL